MTPYSITQYLETLRCS